MKDLLFYRQVSFMKVMSGMVMLGFVIIKLVLLEMLV